MKLILGVLLVLAGIALGLYVGVYLMLIGGIVGIIEQIKAPEIDAMTLALNIVKIPFAGFTGVLSAFVLIIPGFGLIASSKD